MTKRQPMSFVLQSCRGQYPVSPQIDHVILGGWSGRDKAAVEAHIKELEAHGVPRPPSTPAFYPVSVDRLSLSPAIQVSGPHSSGEVEYFMLQGESGLMIGLGSDQTDRKLEAHSITLSKQLCEKVMAPVLWPYSEVRGHWDQLVLQAWGTFDGEEVLYQEGALASMLGPDELIEAYLGNGESLTKGLLMFSGTMPAIGGVRAMERFRMALVDPHLGRSIEYAYDIEVLPVPA